MKKIDYKLRSPGEISWLIISFILVFVVSYFVFEIGIWLAMLLIFLQLVYVLMAERQMYGNSLKISERQFADIDKIIEENAAQLGIRKPNVFIQQDPYINAYAIGFKKPYTIVLTSALVESLNRSELDFVVGHEMGHIKLGHSRMLSLISPLGRDIPVLTMIYGNWVRRAEYSADRAGLYLVGGNIKSAVTTMIKMSVGAKLSEKVELDSILEQIQSQMKDLISAGGEFLQTHPYVMNRIEALVEYYQTDYSASKKLEEFLKEKSS